MLRLLSFIILAGVLVLLACGGTPQEAQRPDAQLDRIEAPPAVASTTALESMPAYANLPSATEPVAADMRDNRMALAATESIALNLPFDKVLVLRI
jgi:hypothetical protein